MEDSLKIPHFFSSERIKNGNQRLVLFLNDQIKEIVLFIND